MKSTLRREGSPRARFVIWVLALTLALAVALAVLSQATATYHRGTAEGVLRDYAAFAAEEFANRAQQRLANLFYPGLNLLTQAGTGRPGGRLPSHAALAPAADQQARLLLQRAPALFRLGLADAIALLPDSSPTLRRWIADTLRHEATRVYRKDWYLALVWGNGPQENRVLVYTVARDASAAPAVAYGFLMRADTIARVFHAVAARSPLLPASLTRGVVVDSVASVRVRSPAGLVLFASELRTAPGYQGSKALDPIFGGLVVEVTLPPALAGRLVIGGLPRSRLPLIAGLLAVTGLLVLTAILQLKREQELTRLRGDFVASVSHELRTPLAQIRMFAETLLLGRVRSESERRRSLEILDQEARRLTHLVDNLLYVARGERNSQPIAKERIELAAAIRDLGESFAPLAASRGVRLELALTPELFAPVDPNALRQILLNLLENAVKYGPAGGRVTIGAERVGSLARIVVMDQGPGVPDALRERIWQRFARLERDLDSAVAGSGIGLAVVRELVAAHGGATRVEDAPGGGARFVVELPL